MVRAGFRLRPQSPRIARWVAGLCAAAAPLLTAGCGPHLATVTQSGVDSNRPIYAMVSPAPAVDRDVRRASYEPDHADAPVVAPAPTPVSLDAVFRLGEERNAKIALAREKLNESLIENQLAAKAWLPKVTAGVGYYRHEGGIQNEDGTLTRSSFGTLYPGVDLHTEFDVREATFHRIDAERKHWQQKGELTQVCNETLLDAASTYIDLLTARRGEAVTQELEKHLHEALRRAEATEKDGGKVLVEAIEAELSGASQVEVRLHQQGDAASAKLAYLLGLDSEALLVPVDETLAPIDLVDVTPATAILVAQALAEGPGIQELQGLLAAIDCGTAEASGPKRFLPALDLCVSEGAFGAGPNSTLDFSNRFDVGVQARWNLTQLFKAKEEKRLAESHRRQVELSYDDLRGKLTLGVREAREAILSGRDQIGKAAEQIRRASESYRLSDLRLKQNAPGNSLPEVLQSLRGLEQAHFNYITSVTAYNKAQVRLLLLLGPSGVCKAAPKE
jgi:outer membrane protein TolC